MNYYIADLHLGHANAIRFDNRPFADVDEMNESLIRSWNSMVTKQDTVYVHQAGYGLCTGRFHLGKGVTVASLS